MSEKPISFRKAVHGRKRSSQKFYQKQDVRRLFFGVASLALASGAGTLVAKWAQSANPAPKTIELTQESNAALKTDRLPLHNVATVPLQTIVPAKTMDRVDANLASAGQTDVVYKPLIRPGSVPVKTIAIPNPAFKKITPQITGAADPVITPPPVAVAYAPVEEQITQPKAPILTTAALPANLEAPELVKPELAAAVVEVAKPKTKGGRIIEDKRGLVEVPGVWAGYIRTPAQEKIFTETKFAARRVGVSDVYLQLVNRNESGHRAIGAETSTAAGPCQFIDSTWLYILKTYGEKHGYKEFADAIKQVRGEYVVSDAKLKAKVMALRLDARAASLMAGEYARENYAVIKAAFPKLDITEAHLYEAHFFGGGDVVKFIRGLLKNPNAKAAPAFPTPAAANYNIFHTKGGKAYSYAQIHANFRAKMSDSFRLEVPQLVSEPQPDFNVATLSLTDIKTTSVITSLSAKRKAVLAKRGAPQTETVSLFSLFKKNAEAQPLPQKKRIHHRVHHRTNHRVADASPTYY